MTRTRKTTLLITSVTVGASAMLGAITSPAGAAEGEVARYNFTQAWPTPPTTQARPRRSPRPDPVAAAPARSSSSGRSKRARADAYQTTA